MKIEIYALEANNTQTLTNIPLEKHPIEWVYKCKLKSNGFFFFE